MHCSFLCRTIFHQTVFQDAFQSKIQNISMVRDMLWDKVSYETQGIFARADLDWQIYKAESKGDAAGKAAKEMVTLPVIGCDWAARGKPALLVMGHTHRGALWGRLKFQRGPFTHRKGWGRLRAAKIRLLLRVFVVVVVLVFLQEGPLDKRSLYVYCINTCASKKQLQQQQKKPTHTTKAHLLWWNLTYPWK